MRGSAVLADANCIDQPFYRNRFRKAPSSSLKIKNSRENNGFPYNHWAVVERID